MHLLFMYYLLVCCCFIVAGVIANLMMIYCCYCSGSCSCPCFCFCCLLTCQPRIESHTRCASPSLFLQRDNEVQCSCNQLHDLSAVPEAQESCRCSFLGTIKPRGSLMPNWWWNDAYLMVNWWLFGRSLMVDNEWSIESIDGISYNGWWLVVYDYKL